MQSTRARAVNARPFRRRRRGTDRRALPARAHRAEQRPLSRTVLLVSRHAVLHLQPSSFENTARWLRNASRPCASTILRLRLVTARLSRALPASCSAQQSVKVRQRTHTSGALAQPARFDAWRACLTTPRLAPHSLAAALGPAGCARRGWPSTVQYTLCAHLLTACALGHVPRAGGQYVAGGVAAAACAFRMQQSLRGERPTQSLRSLSPARTFSLDPRPCDRHRELRERNDLHKLLFQLRFPELVLLQRHLLWHDHDQHVPNASHHLQPGQRNLPDADVSRIHGHLSESCAAAWLGGVFSWRNAYLRTV